ncbi:hypothetical protein [Streptomyces sp. NPDC053079]|uniref:hypothetical protein n=1 Tax=Streptomyces sp. NPDC053079 TaxID=3365697 RepID=UPI0037D873EB
MTLNSGDTQGSGGRLSSEIWEPNNEALISPVVDSVSADLHDVLKKLEGVESGISAGSLVKSGFEGAVPDGWIGTRGSPAFYVRAAIGYLRIAAEGGMCYKEIPESPYQRMPDEVTWCCGHKKPHCH